MYYFVITVYSKKVDRYIEILDRYKMIVYLYTGLVDRYNRLMDSYWIILIKVLSFSAYKKELILNSGRYFGSMFNNSLAHPQVVENVIPQA